ncbi:hypothetical protein CFAM422_007771 [Trichoderma lentiforme]|uniref:RING-type domain-containing protein n=1 Tax=Trichoderma lentiforme TaxID=1567552 RepID=A0A9P5CA72_9HYPO|nr:hypothetical protein CFAM422_007771 [Trichoderma lentiforme]
MWQDEPKKDDDFTRTIAGAFVQFEAGARVSKIRLPSDFSAVRISGLPLNTPAISLQDMLAEMGLHVSIADVHMLQIEGSCGASVRSDDAFFSKKLCAIVQPGYIWQGVKIYATPVAAPMPSSHNARRVDCKKVHISWHKAVRNVWLNFGSGDVARRVSDMFSKGVYRILNQKVTAGKATEAKPAFHPWSPSKNSVAWTVMLTEVPASAERSDILEAITQERNRPRHIEVGLPSYSAGSEQATTLIRSLLTNVGPLEYFEVTLETNARRVKATARFLDEADARRATEELDKKELPFHPKARLTIQMVYSAKFKTGTNIYDAVCPRILPQQKIWRSKNIAFRAYNSTDPLQRFRLLKIEGESAVDIVAAKADLESILAGVVMRENDTVLWDPSLKANGKLYQAIKKLEKECSVVILRDKGKSELRVFGAQECCEEAQLRLAELIRLESLSTSTRAIELQPHEFFWACHGGFRKIAARLGPEKASFDIISTPKKIVISGPLEDYDVAVAILEGRDQVAEPEEQPKPDDATQECSVCWTDAENPIKTGCGHVYCLECFERSCKVGDVTTAAFVVSCHGNQGNCKSIIGVEDLQEHLSSAALEEVLERSFSSHIKRNPNEFRYCPTPDCGYIYRTTSESRIQNCSNWRGAGADDAETNSGVVLVSFMRDLAFWREGASRLGLDLDGLNRAGRFSFVDGLTGLLSGGQGSESTGDKGRILKNAKLDDVRRGIEAAIGDGRLGSKVLIIDQLDELLAISGEEDVTGLALEGMLFSLRERVHATVLTFSADDALLRTQTTSLERSHAALVLAQTHAADLVLSLRLLDTGVAKDVSGVVRIAVRKEEEESTEYLYHIGADGNVKVFERGT